MLTARGWATIAASLGGLLLGLVSANYLLLLSGLVAWAFVLTDVIGFHLKAPGLRPALFSIERAALPSRLPSGSEAALDTQVTYHGPHGFWAELMESVPSSFQREDGTLRLAGWWAPGETWALWARVRVRQRGPASVGPLVVRATGPLGLCFLETAVGPTTELLVVPAARLRERGTVSQRVYARLQGQRAAQRRGFGTDLRSLRPYTSDDDIRHVAWRRSTPESLVARDYEQEGGQNYLLVYDVSPLMGAGGEGRSPLDASAEAGRLLAELTRRHADDALGIMTYSGGVVEYLAPARGPPQYDRVSEALARMEPQLGDFDLRAVAAELRRRLTSPTQVFVFSALPNAASALAPALGALVTRGHRLRLFVPELAAFVPWPARPVGRPSRLWAQHSESERLSRRLTEVQAFGLRAYRFDRASATARLLSAYGRLRTGGGGL